MICRKHGVEMSSDGCIECKKELGLHLTKAESIFAAESSEGTIHVDFGLYQSIPTTPVSPPNFNDAALLLGERIAKLLIRKQRDYGHENILAFGEMGVLVRANDKIARLKNLFKNDATPANESVEDSWMDLAGYSMIALMLREGTFTLPLKEG